MDVNARLIFTLILFWTHTGITKILRLSCSFYADLSIVKSGRTMIHLINTTDAEDDLDCVKKCILNEKCQSINYNSKEKMCDLLDREHIDFGSNLHYSPGWTHYETDVYNTNVGDVCSSISPCSPDLYCEDICDEPGYNCTSL
ncbi:uncharacterized protein LOC130647362 [Hydractinia symbiolongicarpus]|uniref:uncharacterized protein LOC130647362 n=1 Tax=Hydractinia symbiolongicarpus TaxID=13093 RepID=UPI00254EF47B|nr:uncharacterized protein LOC130647362 [Hydractinia symbiolongicarpus]